MKYVLGKVVLFFLIGLVEPQLVTSQDVTSFDLGFEINRVSPKLSIDRETLNEAVNLLDLNSRYKSEWVIDYTSVEISAIIDGELKTVTSQNDILTNSQKDLMKKADVHTDIVVKVRYSPDNNLSHNDIKEMKFYFVVDPDSEASYVGGEQQLEKYLKATVIEKVSKSDFEIYNLTAVKFAIDEKGRVFDTQLVESTKNEQVDAILLDAICNMPAWNPAVYADGTKVKREFVFTVGDHRSCTINLLDIVPIDKYREGE